MSQTILWSEVRKSVELFGLDPDTARTWLKPVRFELRDDGTLSAECPNERFRACIASSDMMGALTAVAMQYGATSLDVWTPEENPPKRPTKAYPLADAPKTSRDRFRLVRDHYPRGHKPSPGNEWLKWQRAERRGVLPDVNVLLEAIAAQMETRKWREGYIKDFERWIAGECWDGE